ncbi:MAG: adenylate kinase [Phycisphaerae bacterium]|nr:adenylate kinase [Phycisphaerae bacterium]
MRVVLMGPPGAGKGTQAERLVEKFGMTHLSSGDIFRAEKSSGSELGEKLAEIMARGELVPDDIVVEMMAKAITAVDGGLLLDGFPRTVAQAQSLDKTLDEAGSPLDAVVMITADDEAIVERITGRRSCPSTGKIYHVKYMAPKVEGICDETGEKLVQRDDDKEEVVRERLKNYKMQTEPVVAYYRDAGKVQVIEVNGMQTPDEVAAETVAALEAQGR